jgi:trans-2,3-dihydro-3-hydroxyanthranilate isomerase
MGASRVSGLPVTVVQACLRDGAGGSPTAIVADAAPLDDDDRRQVPVLAGTSHAVFIHTAPEDDAVSLRFFTAEGELPACGHGTVAALAYLAARAGRPQYETTLLAVGGRRIDGRAQRRGDLMSAEFEVGTVGLREPTAEELALVPPALGIAARALSPGACVATLGRPRMLIPVASRSALDALRPDLISLREACLRLGLLGCYVYTAGQHAAARMFAPAIGVPEDIANANSTACLAAHLHGSAGIEAITVDMGDSLGSPATITATVAGGSVYVGGTARIGRTATRG